MGLGEGSTSQHLAALRRVGVVASCREGTTIYYRVDNSRVFDLLAADRHIIATQIASQQAMLRELRTG
jgi:ArsR family transcriptional regulator